MNKRYNFAVIVPMANESADFNRFISKLKGILDFLESGTVYLIVDNVSKDNTLELCEATTASDRRFVTIWAPENKNVVDAYIRGYREAVCRHDFIIEMDAGMSHDPAALPMFLRALNEGNECAFGSRFINGGSIWDSNLKRRFLSKAGTLMSNLLLGTRMKDMTSGYQGFHVSAIKKLLQYELLSTGHFYQTEVRYLMRKFRYIEVPIHYRMPSPNVSSKSVGNALSVLMFYFFRRIFFQSRAI
ncbi:MAG: glycosyltransferase [Tannerellaceae bacterium]|jgi:dolichol-phosphate mannosyltransferase|nr:glycosyltransferase [Tannerellaceae bacterium]